MRHILQLLAIVPLACAAGAAAAPPTARKPPATRADTCRPGGKVLFEIDHRVIPGARLGTSTTKVFANGAWVHEETDAGGKALAPTSGCLAKADVKQLADTLRGAPWKVTTARLHCMAVSPTFTEYRVDGELVFTARLCSGKSLDDKSRAALDAAVAEVEQAAGKRAQ